MKRLSRDSLVTFILLSLVIHLTFVGTFELIDTKKPVKTPITVEFIEVDEPKPEEKTAEREEKQQIVEAQNDPNLEKQPKEAKFLSKKNQSVEKETRAAKNGDFKNVKPGTPQPQQAQTPKKHTAKTKPNKTPKLADLLPKYGMQAVQPNFPKPVHNPTFGEGVSQTDDYLKDTETDIHTMLNTREFVYFSYYSRIRRRLKQYWEPQIKHRVERMIRQGRSIASSRDRITKLVITLNKKGHLIGVSVLSESGIRDLDDAAVEAFRSAAPFPNPPAGIIESDGTIKIRWDFVLEA